MHVEEEKSKKKNGDDHLQQIKKIDSYRPPQLTACGPDSKIQKKIGFQQPKEVTPGKRLTKIAYHPIPHPRQNLD